MGLKVGVLKVVVVVVVVVVDVELAGVVVDLLVVANDRGELTAFFEVIADFVVVDVEEVVSILTVEVVEATVVLGTDVVVAVLVVVPTVVDVLSVIGATLVSMMLVEVMKRAVMLEMIFLARRESSPGVEAAVPSCPSDSLEEEFNNSSEGELSAVGVSCFGEAVMGTLFYLD